MQGNAIPALREQQPHLFQQANECLCMGQESMQKGGGWGGKTSVSLYNQSMMLTGASA
jgi:hypothetical protein